jgi:dTDP-4-dehydrorhamnose reductase
LSDIHRLVIIGGSGQIGRSLNFGIKTNRSTIDVSDRESVFNGLQKLNASAVLNLASVGVVPSQQDPAYALKINVDGVYNVAQAARKLNIPMILITTGAVFNGQYGTTFNETAIPEPQCVYGKTKHMAELIVRAEVPEYLIVRTGWLFALNIAPKKKFVELSIAAAKKSHRLKASIDQSGSPTYMPDFLSTFKTAITENRRKILHIANKGTTSPYNIAEFVYSYCGLSNMIDPVSFKTFSNDVPRSKAEGLSSRTLNLRPWTDALTEYLKKMIDI